MFTQTLEWYSPKENLPQKYNRDILFIVETEENKLVILTGYFDHETQKFIEECSNWEINQIKTWAYFCPLPNLIFLTENSK